MNLQLPEWAVATTPGDTTWVRALAEAPARQRHGSFADAEVDTAVEEVARELAGVDPDLQLLLLPDDASPGLLVGLVVPWAERLTPETAVLVSAGVRDELPIGAALSTVTTGLDEALVVRRERQLQAVIPERGTGRALVLTWSAFGDVGWDVHERAFAEAVASASSSATVDLAQR